MEAACNSGEVIGITCVQNESQQMKIIKFDTAAVGEVELMSSSMENAVQIEIDTAAQPLIDQQTGSSFIVTQQTPRQNEQSERMGMLEAGSSREVVPELEAVPEADMKNEVSIQANDYEIERATGVLPARKRFIPLKYRDFRSVDDVERDDDKDSDYEPDPLVQLKEPKKKRGRGRPRKYPEGKSDTKGHKEEKKPLMQRTANGYKCLTCNHVFTQKGNLKVHLLTHTDERPWQCDVDNCDKGFRTKESLRRHKLSHMGIKLFECSECKKKFCSAFSLQEHMSLHKDERPYTCSHCQRAFRQISCLRRHLLTHSSEMPHVCRECGRRFSQAVYLRSHMKVHTGEKPFSCDQCDKSFAHASDLTRHKIIHSGSKPYSCSVCSMRFSDPSSRRRHEREHGGIKTYSCHLCAESFKRAGQLRAHLYRRHEGLKEGVEFQIQEGSQPVCYRIELHDPQAQVGVDTDTATTSGRMLDLSALDQRKIISIIHNLNRNMVVQEVEVSGHTAGDTVGGSTTSHISVVAGEHPSEGMQSIVLPLEMVTTAAAAVEKDGQVSSGVVTMSDVETGQAVQDSGPTYQVLQDPGGMGEVEGQPVYEVHYHPSLSAQPSSTATSALPSPALLPEGPVASSAGMETACGVVYDTPASTPCGAEAGSHPALSSAGDCLNSPFVSKPDFGSQDYYDWLSGFTEVCKMLPVPLEVELFQKISQVHKSLSDFMASPSGVIADRDNFKILMSISVDLGQIQKEHLNCMLQNLSDGN